MYSRVLDRGSGTTKHPRVLARVAALIPGYLHVPSALPVHGLHPESPSPGLVRGQREYVQRGDIAPSHPLWPQNAAQGVLTPLCSHRVLGCTPFIALAYFFLWFLPPFTNLRGLWYMTFYCLFQALATVSWWHPFLGLDPWNPTAGQWPL